MSNVTVVMGSGSIGQAIARRVRAGKHVLQLRAFHLKVINQILFELSAKGALVQHNNDLIIINDEWKLSIIIAKFIQLSSNRSQWLLRFDSSLNPDITVAVRMSQNNIDVLDYYIIPHIHIDNSVLKIRDKK